MRTITSSYEDVQIGYKFGNRMSLTSSRRLTMRTCKILVNRRKSCRKIESSDVYLTQILKKDFDFVSGLIYLFTSFFKSIGMLSARVTFLGERLESIELAVFNNFGSNSGPLYPRFNALSTQLLFL